MRRIRAMFRKELRDYRRNGNVIVTMVILPLIFLIQPLVIIFKLPAASAAEVSQRPLLLYMLAIPALVPATIAASAVVSERQQATLEPVLTTPIRREELLIGKALAVLLPSVALSYMVFAIFVACVVLFAPQGIGAALLRGPLLLAQVVFTPLIAAWSIWIGMAISTRTNDVRTAQQFSLLASLPSIAVSSYLAFSGFPTTLALALALGAVLLILDVVGWRAISAIFDRERLITGTG